MKIISLEAENFKRLKAARITPDSNIQVISGRNAQGKSSVLDAIWAALGGKEAAPEKPVRVGAASASVTIDLGEMVVHRNWTDGGANSYLKVTTKDGAKLASPQAILDRLVGKIGFDPFGFIRLRENEQRETLRKMSGLDLSDLDRKRTAVYGERTQINRVVKQQEGQLAGMPEVDAPDEETSIAELLEQQQAAIEETQANARIRAELNTLAAKGRTAKETVDRLKAELAKAETELDRIRTAYQAANAEAANLQDPDVESINAQLADLETVNRNVRAKKARADLVVKLKGNRQASEDLTYQLEQIDAERTKRLEEAAARLPVPGLSLEGDVVTLNGVPLTQASSAEQIRTGLAISAALNPKLRVALIRDGSLIDADGMRAIEEWATANDTQVFLERVSTGSPIGVVIEDGEVVGAQTRELATAGK